MHDELSARQRAISLRLAGQPVKRICAALGRCEAWFHRWWRRYLEAGPEGLYDLTRASHHIARHISPEPDRPIALLCTTGGGYNSRARLDMERPA